MSWLRARAASKLRQIELAGCIREPRVVIHQKEGASTLNGKQFISFADNDYLGLSESPRIIAKGQAVMAECGSGSRSSTVVHGYSKYHQELEENLKHITGRSAAMLFPNAFTANWSICSELFGQGDRIYAPRENHASLNQGMLASRASFTRFVDEDINSVEVRLKNETSGWLVSDHLFSVTGKLAPIDKYVTLAKAYDLSLLIDDVHGFGVLGNTGLSLFEKYSESDLPLVTLGFGKALGIYGGAVVGSAELIDYLRQSARPYIFSTALPAYIPAMVSEALVHLIDEPWRRETLMRQVNYFIHQACDLGICFDVCEQTPIFSITFNTIEKAVHVYRALNRDGYLVTLMRYPTVKKGTGCIRIALNCYHSEAMLDGLLLALKEAKEQAWKSQS